MCGSEFGVGVGIVALIEIEIPRRYSCYILLQSVCVALDLYVLSWII